MSNEPSQEDREWGRRLKQAREALVGDNAANFARQIGMNAQTYRRYERGHRLPRRGGLEIFGEGEA